jgi:hypothetical protein
MRTAGWSVLDLKAAGFDLKSLLTGGCSASELKIVGFAGSEVNNTRANLSPEETSQVRTSVLMRALARRPLSLWFVCRLKLQPMHYQP